MENSELKNRKTEVVDAIIAWLDERIDREEKDMSASEDDSSLLADSEYLQALSKRPLAHGQAYH